MFTHTDYHHADCIWTDGDALYPIISGVRCWLSSKLALSGTYANIRLIIIVSQGKGTNPVCLWKGVDRIDDFEAISFAEQGKFSSLVFLSDKLFTVLSLFPKFLDELVAYGHMAQFIQTTFIFWRRSYFDAFFQMLDWRRLWRAAMDATCSYSTKT